MDSQRSLAKEPLPKKCSALKVLGWVLVIGSFPVWFGLFFVAFLPLETAQKVLLGSIFAGLGEIMFWGGGAILGSSVLARFRKPNVRNGKSYRGKTIAVFGSTGGLGSAIVEGLHREGAGVIAYGRDQAKLDELQNRHGGLETALVDVLSAESLAKMAPLPAIMDGVVIALGMDVRKALSEQSEAEIEEQIALNLRAGILITRSFYNCVRDGGFILLIGGFGNGQLGLPYYSVDIASRAGISAFCQAMNREFKLEGRDLKMCYLCPAPADTAAERPYAELWRKMGSTMVAPEKVADFVLGSGLQRKAQSIMGWQNRLISTINGWSPALADRLGLESAGRLLREAFGGLRGSKGR